MECYCVVSGVLCSGGVLGYRDLIVGVYFLVYCVRGVLFGYREWCVVCSWRYIL
jgi:hypothetical protein